MANKHSSELIEMLQTALEKEYNDAFLYLKEAELFKEKIVEGNKLAAVFEDFSREELRHADRISMELISSGETADYSFNPYKTDPGLRNTLVSHIERETKAYQAYEKMVTLCNDLI